MSTVYSQTCFELPATDAEAEAFIALAEYIATVEEWGEIPDPVPAIIAHIDTTAVIEAFDDPTAPQLGLDIEKQDGGVWCYADEDFDEDGLAAMVRAVVPSALPFSYDYAVTCSRPEPGTFRGGTLTIEATVSA